MKSLFAPFHQVDQLEWERALVTVNNLPHHCTATSPGEFFDIPDDQDVAFFKEAPIQPSHVLGRDPLGVYRGGSSVAFGCYWATGQDDDSDEEAEQRYERSNRHRVNLVVWADEYHRLLGKVKDPTRRPWTCF